MTTINIKELKVTDIQFFNQSNRYQTTEDGDYEEDGQYQANIVFDGKFMVQLSGNKSEANKVSIPSSAESYWNDADAQDLAYEALNTDDVAEHLEELGIENNFYYLQENATERY